MHLFALAISPAIALIWFIYARNAYRPERKTLVAALFVAGAASAAIALVLNHMVEKYTSLWPGAPEMSHRVLFWIGGIGLNEELAKLLVLLVLLYPRRDFTTAYQGFLGAATAALGFATVENLVYLERYGTFTLLVRSVLTVPAHALFAIPMGIALALAKHQGTAGGKYALMVAGLATAALLHGLYDTLLSFGTQPLNLVAYGQVALMGLIAYRLLRAVGRRPWPAPVEEPA